jgi:DnaK suppressor protein
MLLRRRDELVAQMHGQFDDSRRDKFGAGFDDVADRASDSLYDELAQGFAEIAAADLSQIDRVIERIDEHKYGVCADCGQPIPKTRLRLLPFAERCVRCQELDERTREAISVAAPPAWPQQN